MRPALVSAQLREGLRPVPRQAATYDPTATVTLATSSTASTAATAAIAKATLAAAAKPLATAAATATVTHRAAAAATAAVAVVFVDHWPWLRGGPTDWTVRAEHGVRWRGLLQQRGLHNHQPPSGSNLGHNL